MDREKMTEMFARMTENEIVKAATAAGYTVRDSPMGNGKRVGGTDVVSGEDAWMNAANNRLWEIEKCAS